MKYLMILAAFTLYSVKGFAFDFQLQPGELRYLPKYCHAKLEPNIQDTMARDLFGHENSRHMHHYCAGLAYIKRGDQAIGLSQAKRIYLYERGASEIGYLELRMSPDFRLKHELFYYKGYALLKTGKNVEAAQYLQKSINANPNYLKAYRELFDYYFYLKQYDAAERVLNRAFKVAPNSSSLKRRLKKLKAVQV